MNKFLHTHILLISFGLILFLYGCIIEPTPEKRYKYYIQNESKDTVVCLYHFRYLTTMQDKSKFDTLLIPDNALCIIHWDNKDTLLEAPAPSSFLKDMRFVSLNGDTLLRVDSIDNAEWCVFDTVVYCGIGSKWKYIYNNQQ